MTLYHNNSTGRVSLTIRTEHHVGLRDLTLVLYHSNETLGEELSIRSIRTAISETLAECGDNVVVRISDYIREGREDYDERSLVGSDVDKRLEWARRLVLKAYRADYVPYMGGAAALAEFEALPVHEIT